MPVRPSPTTNPSKFVSPLDIRFSEPSGRTTSKLLTAVAKFPFPTPEPCVAVATAPAMEMCGSEAML